MQVSVLASGSKGNATLVAMNGAKILIDAGISATRIKKALAAENVDAANLDAVLLTHEHRDHVAGLATLARWYHLPVYSRRKTLASLPLSISKNISLENMNAVDGAFRLFGLRITPFSVPHDAADPVGYRIEGDSTVTICTDLGFVTQSVAASIDGADVLVLEANHDAELLKNGRYPWPLKRRILGNHGHLANTDAAWAVAHLERKPRDIFLAHLSQENNRPDLARDTVNTILAGQGIEIPLHVTKQDEAVRLR